MPRLKVMYLITVLGVMASISRICLGGEPTAVPPIAAFKPAGLNIWDVWFTQDSGKWHVFYLEYPDKSAMADQSQRHSQQWIGHAVSRDLVHWTESPTALKEPGKGIATGSIVKHEGRWYMLLTHQGFSLAESDDLDTWKWHEPRRVRFGELKADWQGTALSFRLIADPYIYPERIDNWWYAAINGQIVNVPQGKRGVVVLVRSRDLINWESHRIIAYPGRFERLETPQFWRHGERWYLHFGGVDDNGASPRHNFNMIYSGANFDGPYIEEPWSEIRLPGLPRWYLGKRLELPAGDAFLVGQEYTGLSRPFRLEYASDGSPRFLPWKLSEP